MYKNSIYVYIKYAIILAMLIRVRAMLPFVFSFIFWALRGVQNRFPRVQLCRQEVQNIRTMIQRNLFFCSRKRSVAIF